MGVYNTLYSLVNSAMAESMGEHAITIKDTASFLSAGNAVLSTSDNKDNFYQAFADRIGATVTDYKTLNKKAPTIRKNDMRFGMAMQVISIARINRAKASASWGAQSNPFAKEYDTTDVEVRYYDKRGVFDGDTKLVYDYQLETAFTSESAMMTFINAVFVDMYNGMEKAEQELDKETIATMIAYSLDANGKSKTHSYTVNGETVTDTIAPKTGINVLALYNAKFGKSLTTTSCLYDEDYNLFLSSLIDLYVKKIQTPKAMYNPAINETWTDKGDISLRILSEVVTNFDMYLRSKIYHDNFVALPNYEEVDSWQGSGLIDNFEENSKVYIKLEDETTVNKNNILCVLSDVDACGTNYKKFRVKSMYNGASEVTNYYPKLDYGAYVKPNKNCIVFYNADVVDITTTVGDNGTVTPLNPTIDKGDNVTFTITPAEGYEVKTCTLDSVDVSGDIEEGKLVVENVSADATLVVEFQAET